MHSQLLWYLVEYLELAHTNARSDETKKRYEWQWYDEDNERLLSTFYREKNLKLNTSQKIVLGSLHWCVQRRPIYIKISNRIEYFPQEVAVEGWLCTTLRKESTTKTHDFTGRSPSSSLILTKCKWTLRKMKRFNFYYNPRPKSPIR